jgi:hypothetical protein
VRGECESREEGAGGGAAHAEEARGVLVGEEGLQCRPDGTEGSEEGRQGREERKRLREEVEAALVVKRAMGMEDGRHGDSSGGRERGERGG